MTETVEYYYLGPLLMVKKTRGAPRELWEAVEGHHRAMESALFFGDSGREA